MAQRSFWLVAGPALAEGSTRPSKERTVGRIKHVTQLFSDSWDFNIPNLKVGSFDTLMSLSDDLIKIDHFVENVTRKIGTQIYSLVDEPPEFLSVDQANTDTFLKTFNWDEGRFNTRMGCRELADRLQSAVSQIDDEFRGKMNDYSNIASAVTQTQRKRGGTLMVKDFSDCVNPASIYDTDMLKTIFVVVPKYKDQEWQTTYETLVEFSPKNDKMTFFGVVPRSANVIESDNEYVLYDVTVMKRCLDDFKSKSRERGFVVRELHQEEGEFVSGKEALQKLLNEKERQKSKLLLWCKAHFAQCFTAWIHLKSIRVHVECFLRYGFPANFVTVLLQPHKKNLDKKIHASLETLFVEYSNQFLKDTKDDDSAPGLLVAQEKFYPYVFLEINLDMANESR